MLKLSEKNKQKFKKYILKNSFEVYNKILNEFNTDCYAVNSNVIRLGVLDPQTTPLSVNSLGMDFDLKNKIVIKDKY